MTTLLTRAQARYLKDEIYTFTAYILIAVNPYKALPLYSDEIMKQVTAKHRTVLTGST